VVTTEANPNQQPTPWNEKPLAEIHEWQIFDRDYGSEGEDGEESGGDFSWDVNQPYVVGVSGARGSGKSLTLCYMGIRALAMGVPVWSNFPIRYKLLTRHGPKVLEANKLLFKDLLILENRPRGGLILIDEYQDWANNLNFMSTQNKLLNAVWHQIRKDDLCFAYAAKKLRWIDSKTREETDIEIQCKDMWTDPKYRRSTKRGETVLQDYIDWSGFWTGQMYDDYPIVYPMRAYYKFCWEAYDTRQRFDIFEALKGYKLDLTKEVITDKEDSFNLEQIEKKLINLFDSDKQIKASEVYQYLGLKNNYQKNAVSKLIRDIGGEESWRGNSKFFNLDTDHLVD